MIKFFIDANVLIDVMAMREPFYAPAAELWAMVETGQRMACISATSVTTIAYVLRRHADHEAVLVGLDIVLRVFEVAVVDHGIVRRALDRKPVDFEDAVQAECALAANATHIVTRDKSGFIDCELPVIDAREAILLPPG